MSAPNWTEVAPKKAGCATGAAPNVGAPKFGAPKFGAELSPNLNSVGAGAAAGVAQLLSPNVNSVGAGVVPNWKSLATGAAGSPNAKLAGVPKLKAPVYQTLVNK